MAQGWTGAIADEGIPLNVSQVPLSLDLLPWPVATVIPISVITVTSLLVAAMWVSRWGRIKGAVSIVTFMVVIPGLKIGVVVPSSIVWVIVVPLLAATVIPIILVVVTMTMRRTWGFMALNVGFEGFTPAGTTVPSRSIAVAPTTPVVVTITLDIATLIMVPSHFGIMISLTVYTKQFEIGKVRAVSNWCVVECVVLAGFRSPREDLDTRLK
jgi:hypothetical protein